MIQHLNIKGHITIQHHNPDLFTFASPSNVVHTIQEFYKYLQRLYKSGDWKKYYKELIDFDKRLEQGLVKSTEYDNLTTTVGRTEFMKALANEATTATYITYCAVGTDSTAPSVSDTTLGAELERKAVTLLARSGIQVEARTFWLPSEGIGTLTEIGHFLDDATAAVDTGTLFNHSTISETKTASNTLTVIQTFTANDA